MKHIKRDFKIQGPGWTKGVGSKSQNSTFSEQCHGAYQIKGNHKWRSICQQMFCSLIPTQRPAPHPDPLTLGLGSKGQNSFFSEHGHVAYQIKENH